jgi:hypothetical protein
VAQKPVGSELVAIRNIGRWRVGDVEIFSIPEVVALNDDINVLLENATPDLLLKYPWLQPHYATPEGRMIINFQGFVVKAGGRNIVVDSCIGGDRQREYDVFCHLKSDFMEDLKAIGVTPDNVDTVLCTHLHFDHVGWNAQKLNNRWVPTFPKARYLFGRIEYEHWMSALPNQGLPPFAARRRVHRTHHRGRPRGSHRDGAPDHRGGESTPRGQHAMITGDIMHSPVQIAVPD